MNNILNVHLKRSKRDLLLTSFLFPYEKSKTRLALPEVIETEVRSRRMRQISCLSPTCVFCRGMMAAPRNVASFSPKGDYLIQCSGDGVLKVWDTRTGSLQTEYAPSSHLTATCKCLCWCPTNRFPVRVFFFFCKILPFLTTFYFLKNFV